MNSTSRSSRLVSRAARSPALAITGPDVARKLTPSSRATICARVVLPRPGGPTNRTWSSASLRARAASMKTPRLAQACAWPTKSASFCGRSEASEMSSSRRSPLTMRRGVVAIPIASRSCRTSRERENGCADTTSQRDLQLDLVADRNAVGADVGNVGHERADHVDGARRHRDDAEAAALVEAEGVEVVVGDDDAQERGVLLAAELLHGLEQRDADAALARDVVEGGKIDHRPFYEPGGDAGELAVVIGGERLDVVGTDDASAQHQRT